MINIRPQNLVRIIFYYVFVLILLAFVGGISIFYTDWLWFTEIGFQKIFTTIWSTRLLAGLIAGIAVFGIAYINLFICERLTKEKNAHKRLRPEPLISEEGNIEHRIDVDAFIKKLTVPVLLVIAVMAGFFVAGQWQTILQYIHQTSFGINDPIFSKDASYYVFTLPFIQLFLSLGLFIIIISFLSSAIRHYLKGAISFQEIGRAS